MIRSRSLALAVLAMALPAAARGGSPDDWIVPDFAKRMAQVRTVAIVPPDVRLLEITANGTPVYRADWSDWVAASVVAALEQGLRARGLQVRRLEATAEAEGPLREARLLHRAVAAAIFQAHSHGFPGPAGRFDYTLGDLGDLAGPDVDALAFVWCVGANAPGENKAFLPLYGNYGTYNDELNVALVARDGQVLWFEGGYSKHADLTNAVRAEYLVAFVLDMMPKVKR